MIGNRMLTVEWKRKEDSEADCKPGSVVKNHLSSPTIAGRIERLTQRVDRDRLSTFCLALLRMGFASVPAVANGNGELLPHLFTFYSQRGTPRREQPILCDTFLTGLFLTGSSG